MKLSLLIMLAGSLQVSAKVAGQSYVTLKIDKMAITKVLSSIEKQGTYRFIYNSRLKDMQEPVSIDVNNADIRDVLGKIFSSTDLTYQMLDNNLIVVKSTEEKQDQQITGRVTGENGEPLSGVSVTIKGTSRGTTTDNNGNYSLTVPDNAVIVISYIGYIDQEISITNQTVVDVKLQQSGKQLDQVVVVGYGTQRKRDITGATATVSGAEMVKQPVLTATQAIQGKVSGVQIISSGAPGTSPQIRVRGTGTALAGTAALYVVDGVLTDDISNINTADIVDMSILKDASAAAIYGSRGANGVVLITTRKGSVGKMKITYNNNLGVRQAANLVKMANAAEYNNYYQAATGQIPPTSTANTDWYGTILRNAFEQSHNISLSGGTEKVLYFFSAGYLTDQGIVLNNDFKRFTLRTNNEFRISKEIKFGLQASYANAVNQNGFGNIDIDPNGNIGSVYNDAYRAAPIVPSIVNGKYGNTSAYQNVGNPLLDINDNNIRVKDNRLQGTAYLEIKPISWLTFRSSLGGDLDNQSARAYYYQFNADESTFIVAGGNQYNAHSSLTVKNTQAFRWVWDNIFTLAKRFDKHDFSLMLGTTSEKYQLNWLSATRRDVPPDQNLWYIYNGDANSSQNDGSGDAWARNSYLARLNYSYDGRYLLTATVRRDGSSRFPEQNRWGTFPSVGVAWILTKEKFMENQKLFDNLKLRGSWGQVGNDQIPTDAFTTTVVPNLPYPYSGAAGAATNGAQVNQVKDPNITWETTEEIDGGLEFAMLNNRLTGEVNYYNKKVRNALIYVRIPSTVGDADGQVLTNAASIQNKGWEVMLNWKDNINEKWSYHVGGNVTLNNNKVIGLNGGQPLPDGGIGASQGFVTLTDNGQPVGSFYVLKMLGIFQSDAEVQDYKNKDGIVIQPTAHAGDIKYQDTNGDGKIDDNDRTFAGSYQPVAYFGLNGGLNYKNWDFSFDIYGNVGNQVYNGKRAVRVAGTDNIESALVYNRWTPSNHSQTQPAANGGNQLASTYFVEPGDFIRLNNVTIGYTFPAGTLQKIKVTSLRVFITGQNIVTLKKYSGFTAELPGGPTNSGIELSAYPTTRTFAGGIYLGF